MTQRHACAFAFALLASVITTAACKEPAPDAPAAVAAPPATPAPAANAPSPVPAAAAPAAADEACGQMILVAYAGAAHVKRGVTRDKAAAAQRARELLEQLRAGGDFAALATSQSDAPSSAPRGGVFGTFKKDAWPPLHAALRDPLFALQVGALAPAPIEADYGYALLRRCAVEKAHARHILVRYRGAPNAGSTVKRSRAEAEQQARALLAQLQGGADFAALAKTASEDGSATRGGDVGTQGRGAFALAFERALFALQPGQRSDVIETEFGFHIIERLPD